MCNRFNLRTNLATLTDWFAAMLSADFETSVDVFPNQPTPVLAINREGRRECLPMRFGLIPFGKSPDQQKRPLTNARVENLDKWPWKSSIKSYRCVVPMTGFREPCYWGETAGTEVDFNVKDDRPMLAAAIYTWVPTEQGNGSSEPIQPKSAPVFSMSLIMRPALPIVMEHGHHRSPFFLSEDGVDEWMQRESRPLSNSLDILREHAIEPNLTTRIAREMAAAWVKRQSGQIAKRDQQVAAVEQTGPLGLS